MDIPKDKIKLTNQHKELLDERLKTYHNSTKRTAWDTVKKKVRAKKAK